MLTLIIFSICRKKIFLSPPLSLKPFFSSKFRDKVWHNIYMAGKVRLQAIRKKCFWNFPSGKFQNFLVSKFQFNKKLKFSEFSQFLQLDGASSVCPANFFLRAYSITFQTSIFSSEAKKRFAHSKQKSAEKNLKMRFLQGAKKM